MHRTGGRGVAAPVTPRRRASAADPSRARDVRRGQRPAAVRAAQLHAAAQGCHMPHRARVVRPTAINIRCPSRAAVVRGALMVVRGRGRLYAGCARWRLAINRKLRLWMR